MNSKTALKIILLISLIGILFSGYLTYSELSAGTGCSISGGCQILKMPTCFYGLIMYIVVFIISLIGQKSKK